MVTLAAGQRRSAAKPVMRGLQAGEFRAEAAKGARAPEPSAVVAEVAPEAWPQVAARQTAVRLRPERRAKAAHPTWEEARAWAQPVAVAVAVVAAAVAPRGAQAAAVESAEAPLRVGALGAFPVGVRARGDPAAEDLAAEDLAAEDLAVEVPAAGLRHSG